MSKKNIGILVFFSCFFCFICLLNFYNKKGWRYRRIKTNIPPPNTKLNYTHTHKITKKPSIHNYRVYDNIKIQVIAHGHKYYKCKWCAYNAHTCTYFHVYVFLILRQMTQWPTSARLQTSSSLLLLSGRRESRTSLSFLWMTRSSCCEQVRIPLFRC